MTPDGLLRLGDSDLGERVVRAARLAVAVHLYELTQARLHPRPADTDGQDDHANDHEPRQRVRIGGAGPTWVAGDDGAGQAPAPDAPAHDARVTDDPRPIPEIARTLPTPTARPARASRFAAGGGGPSHADGLPPARPSQGHEAHHVLTPPRHHATTPPPPPGGRR